MGRLLKKKDADKKRSQRQEKSSETGVLNADGASRPAPPSNNPPVAAKPKTVTVGEDNFVRKSIQFLREVKTELRKVTWPSRKQTMGSTMVVIILVMIIAVFLGTVDFGLAKLVRIVLP